MGLGLSNVRSWFRHQVASRVFDGAARGLPRDAIADPRLVSYHDPGPGRGFAIMAPREGGMAFNAFTLGADSYHPWFLAAKLVTRHEPDKVRNLLATYYSLVQPSSMCDWLDIPVHSSQALAAFPIHGWMVLPWSPADPRETLRKVEEAQLRENRQHGLDEGMSAGAKAFGPVSERKLEVEARRISELAVSIRQHGLDHRRPDYNIKAVFLVSGEQWRWLSAAGMHRVPVAAGLGVAQIPVRVAAVVRRDEVKIWPQVAAGLYDEPTALRLFDRLFEGRAPRPAGSWIEWVDTQRSNIVEQA
jgi:hypothetical protein